MPLSAAPAQASPHAPVGATSAVAGAFGFPATAFPIPPPPSASASSASSPQQRGVEEQLRLPNTHLGVPLGAVSVTALCRRQRRQAARAGAAVVVANGASAFAGAAGSTSVGPTASSRSARLGVSGISRRVFDCFRDDAITAIYAAQEEAMRLGIPAVRTELLLLGFVAEEQKIGAIAKAAMLGKGLNREALRRAVVQLQAGRGDVQERGDGKLSFTDNTKRLFDVVSSEGKEKDLGSENMLIVLTSPQFSDCGAARVLTILGVNPADLQAAINTKMAEPAGAEKELAAVGATGGDAKLKLEEVATNLSAMAREGQLDPVIGRDAETQRVMQILLRKRKNNACLVGPPGVGKTAVAEGLAQRIVEGNVPAKLRGKEVFSLDMGQLVAGTKYRGEFEERIKGVIDEVRNSELDICLFIDEIHQLVGAGVAGPDSSMDAANMLKPALARGELQVVGATTLDEYTKHIEKDAALERRFQKVVCNEPSPSETRDILEGLRSSYEAHHGVLVSPDAIDAAVRFSTRFIPERFLPDKAIDLIDEAGSLAQIREGNAEPAPDGEEQKPLVTAADIANVLSRWAGVPVERLSEDEAGRLLRLEETLATRIIGQDEAVSAMARAVRRSRAGLTASRRPIASLYFAGPTGVGKTELCNVLAAEYYSDDKALIRLDMSEYSEQYSVSRLVGPPPGYVGYEDPRSGQLTEAVRRRPYSVVVLDEIEKAHPEVMNLLLQVLEDGRLTDGKGRTVNFSNCIIVMTSNVGSREILSQSNAGAAYSALKASVMAQLQNRFRPEFLNRLDELLVFRALGQAELRKVAVLALEDAAARVATAHMEASAQRSMPGSAKVMLTVDWTTSIEDEVVACGADSSYGARPLRRAVQKIFEDPLAEFLVSDSLTGDTATVDIEDGAVIIQCSGSVFRPRLAAVGELQTDAVAATLGAGGSSTTQAVAPAVSVS